MKNCLDFNLYYKKYTDRNHPVKVLTLEEYENKLDDEFNDYEFINLLSMNNDDKDYIVGNVYVNHLNELYIFGLLTGNNRKNFLKEIGFYNLNTIIANVSNLESNVENYKHLFINFNSINTNNLLYLGNLFVNKELLIKNIDEYLEFDLTEDIEEDILNIYKSLNRLILMDKTPEKRVYYSDSLSHDYTLKENDYLILLGLEEYDNQELLAYENSILVLNKKDIINKEDKLISSLMFVFDNDLKKSVLVYDYKYNTNNYKNKKIYSLIVEKHNKYRHLLSFIDNNYDDFFLKFI